MRRTTKIWSQLWDHGSPFVAPKLCNQVSRPLTSSPIITHISRRAFSESRNGLYDNSSPSASLRKDIALKSLSFLNLSEGSTASRSISSYAPLARRTLSSTTALPRRFSESYFHQTWLREIHSSARRRARGYARRNKSSASNLQNGRRTPQDPQKAPPTTPPPKGNPSEASEELSASSRYHLPHMPKMPHRPTKEELLAAATGFWSRLKVRFKWFSIRSGRPWNVDDWSAFVSWFVLGNIAWIFIGTTTFFSLVIFSINTVVAQGMYFHYARK
jgi:distribution and morphology protein 31